jgi:hypothetical protein
MAILGKNQSSKVNIYYKSKDSKEEPSSMFINLNIAKSRGSKGRLN